MLEVEGYDSLPLFYGIARHVIGCELTSKISSICQEPMGSIDWDTLNSNIDVAAKFLVWDLFRIRMASEESEKREGIRILRGDGSHIGISHTLFHPKERVDENAKIYSVAREKAEKDGEFSKWESAFGLQSLASAYWHDSFISETVFNIKARPLFWVVSDIKSTVSAINWDTGSVCLDELILLAKAAELIRQGNEMLARIKAVSEGLNIGGDVNEQDLRSMQSQIQMLQPYEGCMIIAPNNWLKVLIQFGIDQKHTHSSISSGRPPVIKDQTREAFAQLYPDGRGNDSWLHALREVNKITGLSASLDTLKRGVLELETGIVQNSN